MDGFPGRSVAMGISGEGWRIRWRLHGHPRGEAAVPETPAVPGVIFSLDRGIGL